GRRLMANSMLEYFGKKNVPTARAQPRLPRGSGIIVAESLRKTFRMGDNVVHVLRDATLAVRAGEFVAIEGRSGSGKSTLLHIMGALDESDAGSIEVKLGLADDDGFDGRDLTRLSGTDRSRLRN